ncbi:MAG: VOC family protein [Planctomycetota bacterium]
MQQHHAIDYIEISVTDMAAAKQFYSAAFGWQFTDYAPVYAGIQRVDGDGEMGGICLVDSLSSGGPLVILFSNDLQQTQAAVEAADGEISTPIFEFPGGRRFHFKDPSGNELAVWSPS